MLYYGLADSYIQYYQHTYIFLRNYPSSFTPNCLNKIFLSLGPKVCQRDSLTGCVLGYYKGSFPVERPIVTVIFLILTTGR